MLEGKALSRTVLAGVLQKLFLVLIARPTSDYQLSQMDMSAAMPRTLHAARRAVSGTLAASRSAQTVGGITLPMAIWSRRQFSSGQSLSLPTPLAGFGGSSGSSGPPSYFQRTQRLPTNTIVNFVPQQQAWVVERFGRFSRILEPGLTFLIPAVDVRTWT